MGAASSRDLHDRGKSASRLEAAPTINPAPDDSKVDSDAPRRWFDRPFDRLTVLSVVEGLSTLSKAEGESS